MLFGVNLVKIIMLLIGQGSRSILFYSILFYSILFYSILFYSILFYSILFYSKALTLPILENVRLWQQSQEIHMCNLSI
jgi:hypothetical protein